MSGTRFDKWRALAIEAVENDLRERDFALAKWGEDVRTGSRLWADYLCDAFDGQASIGQLVSGAMVLAFWWLRIPRDFVRSLVQGVSPVSPPGVMFLPPPAPPAAPAPVSAEGKTPPVASAGTPPDGRKARRSAVKGERKAAARPRAKARRAAPHARRRAAGKRSPSG